MFCSFHFFSSLRALVVHVPTSFFHQKFVFFLFCFRHAYCWQSQDWAPLNNTRITRLTSSKETRSIMRNSSNLLWPLRPDSRANHKPLRSAPGPPSRRPPSHRLKHPELPQYRSWNRSTGQSNLKHFVWSGWQFKKQKEKYSSKNGQNSNKKFSTKNSDYWSKIQAFFTRLFGPKMPDYSREKLQYFWPTGSEYYKNRLE